MQPDAVNPLFDEWAAGVARGEQPDPVDYLARAGDDAAELERMMDRFLVAAPRSEPDDETVTMMHAWASRESPLVAFRVARGLKRDQLVDAIMARFLLVADKREIVKRYVHRLEAGLIDPRRLSRPLVELLSETLRISAKTVLSARAHTVQAAPAFRAEMASVQESLSREEPEDDEGVRSLFISSR